MSDVIALLAKVNRQVSHTTLYAVPQWRSKKFSTGGASICSIPFCPFPFSCPTKSAVQSKNVTTYIPPDWLNEQWCIMKIVYFPDRGCVRHLYGCATGADYALYKKPFARTVPVGPTETSVNRCTMYTFVLRVSCNINQHTLFILPFCPGYNQPVAQLQFQTRDHQRMRTYSGCTKNPSLLLKRY